MKRFLKKKYKTLYMPLTNITRQRLARWFSLVILRAKLNIITFSHGITSLGDSAPLIESQNYEKL
jgi:hypothetical protein